MANNRETRTDDWLAPHDEEQSIRRYLETMGERARIIALVFAVTTLAAVIYVLVAPKVYEATAEILVTPVQGDDPALSGLGLIRSSSDPTRDVQTAAKLLTSADIARRAKQELGTEDSASSLEADITAEPVAQSNIVALTAKGSSPKQAQRRANTFARVAIEDHTDRLHAQVDAKIKALEAAQNSTTDSASRAQLARLRSLAAGNDPTLQLSTRAEEPTAPVSPRRNLSILAGMLAGIVLGIAAAFAAQMIDPRLRREEQLRSQFRLPILARIPSMRGISSGAIAPRRLTPTGVEAFRTLRATLDASPHSSHEARSVMITGTSPSEGKTTIAINLAASLALTGKTAIVVEADVRRPSMAQALGVVPSRGIASVLVDEIPLEDALTPAIIHDRELKLLLVDRGGEWLADQFSLPAAHHLIDQAKAMADYVIIDSPPLTEVVDALPLAQMSDDVVIAVRLGKTQVNRLRRLGELLSQHNVRPFGFVLVGVQGARPYGYKSESVRPGSGIIPSGLETTRVQRD